MTEQIKSIIDRLIDTRDFKYSHFCFTDDTGKAFDLAIRSLQAWEEVMKKLEEREIEYSNNEFKPLTDNTYWSTRNLGIRDAINIINQHLSEIEERN